MRILLIDDNPADARIFKDFFKIEFPWVEIRYEYRPPRMSDIAEYDGVICDYFGGSFHGDELAKQIADSIQNMNGCILTDYTGLNADDIPAGWRVIAKSDFFSIIPIFAKLLADWSQTERYQKRHKLMKG